MAVRQKHDPVVERLVAASMVFLAALLCGAQVKAKSGELPETSTAYAQQAKQISIGQSLTPLYGPWKFQIGDSPIDPVTHAPLWARPDFDDSAWETIDLASTDRDQNTDNLSGWTSRGHAGQSGYAWYRIRLHFDMRHGEKLALSGPAEVDDAYQVFLNGRLLGSFGDFSGNRPVTYYTQPMMFPLTPLVEGGSSPTEETLAFRVWMEPNTLVTSTDAGGFRSAPVVGEAGAVLAGYRLRWLALLRKYSPFVINALLFLMLSLVAFSLILFDRSDQVYLWMGAVFLLTAAYSGLGAFDVWTQHVSILTDSLLTQCFLGPLAYAGWVMVWWVWFGKQKPAFLPLIGAGLAALYMISNAIAEELFYPVVPHAVAFGFEVVSLTVRLLFIVLLLWIVSQGIRKRGLDGWMVLPAILLLGIGLFQTELAFAQIQLNWFPLGLRVALGQIANLLLVAALALLLLRRLLLSVRRQRLIEMDVKRAQLQSDFVSAVSHEFRSPLTTLRTITDLLVQNRIPDESRRQQSYVFLDRETTRLQRLVEDLLDFGRMESGGKLYRIEPHDAFRLVRAAIAEVGEQVAANGFRVEADLDPDPAIVHVDEEAFSRAVRNLLENAMKYSPESRTVWVEGTVTDRQVSISVRDRGMGIDAIEQEAIFQKFVRGTAAKEAGIKGTGVGLAMVQQITEAMGGKILLESEVGAGSTFTIVLPLADD